MGTTAQDGADRELGEALALVSREPLPGPQACLQVAGVYGRRGEAARAVQWAFAATDAGTGLADWLAAGRIIDRYAGQLGPAARRARVAVLGSYTTAQFAALLRIATARAGVDVEIYESGYDQYRMELLNPESRLYAFRPDIVVLAVHDGAVTLPEHSDDPEAAVDAELARWTSLWDLVADRLGARVVQHMFAVPPEVALGHLARRVPGSRYAMLHRLNSRLGEAAGDRVGLVDCERLSASAGKHVWFDARYYHLAKQAVGLDVVALLARHTAAVIGAQLGLSRKCLVLDLDNTLWGGVLGEAGPHGIALGSGAVGEAYSAFQRYVLELKRKGVVLAVCSKNNDADVREAFQQNPDMLLRLEDIAVLMASWEDKPAAIRRIAERLGIGLDSLVFVDDNPAEREAVRQLVPEVDVVALPAEPAGYVRALADYPFFEMAAVTAEDAARTDQYRARAEAAAGQASAGSLEEFLDSLDMHAVIDPITEANIARVTQLIGKTNQFNLTTHRLAQAEVELIGSDPAWLSQVVRLRDRFADHGIIGVLLACQRDTVLEVDTWLLSCRVIGRRVEETMMAEVLRAATARGCTLVRGTYLPSPKNGQVADLYERLGFTPAGTDPESGATFWERALPASLEAPAAIGLDNGLAAQEVAS